MVLLVFLTYSCLASTEVNTLTSHHCGQDLVPGVHTRDGLWLPGQMCRISLDTPVSVHIKTTEMLPPALREIFGTNPAVPYK